MLKPRRTPSPVSSKPTPSAQRKPVAPLQPLDADAQQQVGGGGGKVSPALPVKSW